MGFRSIEFSSQLKKCSLIFAFACLLAFSSVELAKADGCWGSSRGGWGSGGSLGGGSWGCRGGMLSNAPVRNLLARIGNGVGNGLANLGDGVAGVLERRPLRNALFGCNGSNGCWGSRGGNGGSSGGWGSNGGWGCSGSYAATGSTGSNPGFVSVPGPAYGTVVAPAPMGSSNLLDLPLVTTDGYACVGSVSAYTNENNYYDSAISTGVQSIETSAPVLDYGFYGTQYGPIGTPTDATIVDGALITGPMMEAPVEPGSGSLNSSPGDLDLPGYYDGDSEPTPENPFGAQEEDDSAFLPRGKAILSLNVPEEARVYINDKLTNTDGTRRQYVSRNLVFGQEYRYRVRVVSDVDGKEVEKSRVVTMRGGESSQFAFNFDPIVTRVVVSVPEDAKVIIDGKETSTAGAFRTFSTEKLKTGKWEDYSVEVSVVRNGQTLTKKESFDLGAGEFRFFEFEFDKASAGSIASK